MAEGWIKLYRCLLEKAIWTSSTPEQKVILITLLTMANHEEKEWEWQGKQFKADPGQFVTSLNSIVEKCGKGITTQNVRSALAKFKKYDFLTYQSTKTGRLITIVNWGLYQDKNISTNKATNKEVTKSQQSTNKEVTTNKNDKNDKNDKNIRESTHSSQSLDLIKYYSELLPGQDISAHMATLNIWIEMYGYEWTKEAIQKCVSNKKKFIKSYIEVILKNWVRDGKEENYGGTRQDNGENKFKGFRPAKPKISENIDTSDLI